MQTFEKETQVQSGYKWCKLLTTDSEVDMCFFTDVLVRGLVHFWSNFNSSYKTYICSCRVEMCVSDVKYIRYGLSKRIQLK